MRILHWDILDEDGEFEVGVDLVGSEEVPVKGQGSAVPDVALPVVEVEVLDGLGNACSISLINLDEADHEWRWEAGEKVGTCFSELDGLEEFITGLVLDDLGNAH